MNIFAALDLETTGLDPAHCEVLELAIVPLNEDLKKPPDWNAPEQLDLFANCCDIF